MRRLSKDQHMERADLSLRLREAYEKLEASVARANEILGGMRDELNARAEEVNEVVAEANEWRDNVRTEMDDFFNDRSDKWQESDAGGCYQDWMAEWDNEIEKVRVEAPAEIDTPDFDADVLDNLPDEPG